MNWSRKNQFSRSLLNRYFGWVVLVVALTALVPQQSYAGVAKCFGMTDGGSSARMIHMVPNSGISPLPTYSDITLQGAHTDFNAEGSAYRPSNRKMYLFDCAGDNNPPCDLYEATLDFTVSPPTATTALMKANIVPGATAYGAVEGAIWETDADAGTDFLYAAVGENEGDAEIGQIYKWDPTDWSLVAPYPIDITGATEVLTGLAYQSATDSYFGSIDSGSVNPRIFSVNMTTGVTSLLGSVTPDIDGEGFSYAADGKRYMESESSSSPRIYAVDLTSPPYNLTAAAIITSYAATGRDYESLACNDGERSDLGDAPSSYGTAVHSIPVFNDMIYSTTYLGTNRPDNDDDPTTQSGTGADGDDTVTTDPNSGTTNDEDGVTLLNGSQPTLQDEELSLNSTYTLVVTPSGANNGYLNAWFDLNADGDFDDTGEQIADSVPATSGTPFNVSVTIPATTPAGVTYARFRYSMQQDLPSEDDYLAGEEALDGEVEDYKVTLIEGGDIQVTKSASPDPVASGENLTYTLTVTNNGPGSASDVVVTDTLSSGMTFVSANVTTGSGSCTHTSPDVTCNITNTIPVNDTAIVTIIVTVN